MATFNYITPEGITIPDTAEVLRETQAEYESIFGGDLVLDPGTPEARLIDAETLARVAVVRDLGGVVNQINPEFSEGQFLDNFVKISGLPDIPEEIYPAPPEGIGSAIRAAPEVARTSADNLTRNYYRTIIRPQRDAAIDRMYNDILALPSVRSVFIRENIFNIDSSTIPGNISFIFDNYTLAPNSIFLLVQFTSLAPGPEDLQAVARVALNTRTVGPRFVSADTINEGPDAPPSQNEPVTDPLSGSVYNCEINRPIAFPFDVRFSAFSESAVLPADLRPFVRSAINDYGNGLISGERGFTIGTDISPFELAGAVNARFPEIFISNLEIKNTLSAPEAFSTEVIAVRDVDFAILNPADSGVIQV